MSDAEWPRLPEQRADTPWPDADWPESEPDEDVDRDRLLRARRGLLQPEDPSASGDTHALLAVHRGRLVDEGYGPEQDRDTTLISWSMAKSMVHALVGVLVGEGRLDPAAPAPIDAWRGDARREITLEHLLRMVDGLDFFEDYVDGKLSHVIDMLFQTGKSDVAAYAIARPLEHAPGTWWNYSSGTSNIVSRIVGDVVGGGEAGMRAFLQRELFERLGMRTATPRFDEAGTFIGSSYVFATARDFARFGLLYLRDGIWNGERVLPERWVDHARTVTPASKGWYGAHWWHSLDGSGRFHCSGFNGQYIVVDPARDLVVVRLGLSNPSQRPLVMRTLADYVGSFPTV